MQTSNYSVPPRPEIPTNGGWGFKFQSMICGVGGGFSMRHSLHGIGPYWATPSIGHRGGDKGGGGGGRQREREGEGESERERESARAREGESERESERELGARLSLATCFTPECMACCQAALNIWVQAMAHLDVENTEMVGLVGCPSSNHRSILPVLQMLVNCNYDGNNMGPKPGCEQLLPRCPGLK